MIKRDRYPIAGLMLLITLASVLQIDLLNWIGEASRGYPLLSSFVKFAILATAGELLGARISSGGYPMRNFGWLPKAVVWGILGVAIKIAFVIFSSGVPQLLTYYGLEQAPALLKGALSADKAVVAFTVSLAMNLVFAPVLMVLHKVTDLHIQHNRGHLRSLIVPIEVGAVLNQINWDHMWSFVFKKTIPLFWIPAHTITFLLPVEYQVLFAAALGVLLGMILALPGRSVPTSA